MSFRGAKDDIEAVLASTHTVKHGSLFPEIADIIRERERRVPCFRGSFAKTRRVQDHRESMWKRSHDPCRAND
jgi:hypothetical protein